MTRVLVVEDQPALADALQIAIDAEPDLECAGVVATAEDALKLTAAQDPDIVLMDIHLHGPGPDGIEATRQIKEYAPGIRVLILTADSTPDMFSGATAAGADGFLAKDSALPDLLAAIRTPADKTVMVEGATLAALFKDYRREESPHTPGEEN